MLPRGSRARRLLLTLLACGAAVAAPRAAAAQDRVLVWSVQASGSAEGPMLREQLYRSLAGGFAAAGFAVVPRQEIGPRLAATPGLVGCETSPCLKRVAELLGVRRIIRAQVEIFGSSYVYRLESLGPDGRLRHRAEGRCDVCTVAEVNEQVSQAAVKLARAREAPTPPPPPGAEPPPPPTGDERPAAAASPPPPPTPATTLPTRDRPRRLAPVWKWAALGTSAIAIIVGASLAAIDGHGSCSRSDGGTCARLYDTGAAGWTLTAVGVAGLVGTGAWFWFDRPVADRRRATAGGVALRLGF
jgi:hypothetical protein